MIKIRSTLLLVNKVVSAKIVEIPNMGNFLIN